MAKTKKPPIAEVGDRIIAPGSVGVLEAIIPGKKPKYQVKWANDRTGFYTEFELKTIASQVEKKKPDFAGIRWKIGDRCQFGKSVGTITELNGNLARVRFDDADPTGKGNWVGKEQIELCKSEPAESSRESAGSLEQLSLLADLTGEFQSNETRTQLPFLNPTSTIESSGQTSETFTQARENMTSLLEDSPAPTHQEPETELELLTYLQNLGQCSESSSDVLEKPDPHLSFWNSLQDLSIEDLEHGLEDSSWEDIRASIRSSLDAINLERSSDAGESLSFRTLLAGHGGKHRDVGLTECEKWWKKNVIQTIGSQLSAEAIASLHGFPANWFRSISPPSPVQLDTQDDSQPESLEGKPLPSPKPELPSNVSSKSGQNLAERALVQADESLGKSHPSQWEIGDRFVANSTDAVAYQVMDIKPEKIKIKFDNGNTRWYAINLLIPWCGKQTYLGRSPNASESLGKSQTHTEKESRQAGSLYQYTSNKRGKDGVIREYPIVEGRDRDRANDNDWYWGISYIESLNGKRCDRSASIPRKSLPLARVLMFSGFLYSATIEAAQYKFCSIYFRGDWIIGEIRPEICPSLFICNVHEREFFIIPGSEWGGLRVEQRTAKRRLIMGAIANNETLTQIKEKLNNAQRVPQPDTRPTYPTRTS